MGAVAQRDDLGIEPFEALTQPCGGEIERQFLGKIEVETLYEGAKDHELTMEAHGGAADAAEHRPPFAYLVGEDLPLDAVELAAASSA